MPVKRYAVCRSGYKVVGALFHDTRTTGRLEDPLPPKTERPESFPAERPIDHHVAGRKASTPDKRAGARGTIGTTPLHTTHPRT